ncbi:MAG: tRNA (cytosine(32)/uridine(32)-2'-O)-methyltransferase TrmJ, partial [Candidatus Porifericomitaceae bacterium WSBS_2022_MAG_OTU9]
CYELALACHVEVDAAEDIVREAATVAELDDFYVHLAEMLRHTGFMPPEREQLLMRRLRALFGRAMPDANETRMLRGILSSVLKLRQP